MTVIHDILLERRELEHRFPPEHVDQHFSGGELAMVAAFYSQAAAGTVQQKRLPDGLRGWVLAPVGWPLDSSFWSPAREPRRNIVRSIAYAAMEADRLERAAMARRAAR